MPLGSKTDQIMSDVVKPASVSFRFASTGSSEAPTGIRKPSRISSIWAEIGNGISGLLMSTLMPSARMS